MNRIKKIFLLICIIGLILYLTSPYASNTNNFLNKIGNYAEYIFNNTYNLSDSFSANSSFKTLNSPLIKDGTFVCNNEEAFFNILTLQMVERNNTIIIDYYGDEKQLYDFNSDSSKKLDILLSKAFSIDYPYISDDFDYLQFNYTSVNSHTLSYNNHTIFTFKFKYLTTNEEEQIMKSTVKSLLNSLDIYKKSDYEKIKIVHDYLAQNTSYDETLKKHSAYNLFINKSSVCQGYSLATYYMLTDLGVPCRIVSGTAYDSTSSSGHSWNIVKLNDLWYNLDVTWDDPIISWSNPDYFTYDYFLMPNSKMTSHIRDSEYNSEKFNNEHPMSNKEFKQKMDTGIVSANKPINYIAVTSIEAPQNITLKKGKSKKVSFTLFPSDKTDNTIYYTSLDPNIVKVNSKGKVTAYKKGTTTIFGCTPNGNQASYTVAVK